jgi:hypothetical protein
MRCPEGFEIYEAAMGWKDYWVSHGMSKILASGIALLGFQEHVKECELCEQRGDVMAKDYDEGLWDGARFGCLLSIGIAVVIVGVVLIIFGTGYLIWGL